VRLEGLIEARKLAEAAVGGMSEGPLKTAAFETILASLLKDSLPDAETPRSNAVASKSQGQRETGTAGRISSLAADGFFAQPRSLPEIQEALSERGWHYEQHNLSTPLRRMVRARGLRRMRANEGRKTLWKYSTY
jgi:hypothetical protein